MCCNGVLRTLFRTYTAVFAGFIINVGGASATDVTDLMKVVQETVMDRYGVLLEPEVRIID